MRKKSGKQKLFIVHRRRLMIPIPWWEDPSMKTKVAQAVAFAVLIVKKFFPSVAPSDGTVDLIVHGVVALVILGGIAYQTYLRIKKPPAAPIVGAITPSGVKEILGEGK
jgi:hypothetical protein